MHPAQIIAEREWVYWLDESDSQPTGPHDPPIYRVYVVVAKERERYPVTTGIAKYWSQEFCEEMNRRRGYTPEDAMRVVGTSMVAGRI